MVAIIDGQPKLLNLKQVIEAFLRHRREVVTRRTIFELRKARERGHILEGLAVALSNVDEIIALIKAAPTPPDAKRELMARSWRSSLVEDMLSRVSDASRPDGLAPEFGLVGKGNERGYFLSDAQAQAILELRLQRLTGLEQDKIVGEYREVMDKITDLLDILAKPARVTQIIGDELVTIRSQFGDKRRSEIITHTQDMSMEDLIAPEDVVVTMSHGGYMKAQKLDEYRAQKRGGRGKQATATKEDDFVDNLFIANTHDYILCFSNRGRVYWLKVYDVPQGTRISRGKPIVNLLPLEAGEKINAILPVKQFTEDQFIFFATTDGTVKKTPLSDFANPRKAGIIAINLDEGDFLIGVAITDGKHDVMLFSDEGKAVRFDENDVRSMGRVTRGVRGMNLAKGGKVIALLVAENETADRADRDRERFRQAHADRRIHPSRTRHAGHDRDPDLRAQRQGGGGDAGQYRRRDHADRHQRRADPHPRQRDPRDEPRHAGRDADEYGRRREAGRFEPHRRNGRRGRGTVIFEKGEEGRVKGKGRGGVPHRFLPFTLLPLPFPVQIFFQEGMK